MSVATAGWLATACAAVTAARARTGPSSAACAGSTATACAASGLRKGERTT